MHMFSVFKTLFRVQEENVSTNEVGKNSTVEKVNKKDNSQDNKTKISKVDNSNTQDKNNYNTCYALFPKDGDTFVGMHNNEKKTFRLAGINTPEKDTPWAKEATNFLREKIGKKVVYIDIIGKDKYNREIVEVYLDKEKQQHVNDMLISAGLATSERYALEGEKTHSAFEYVSNEMLELQSKITGKGMWGNETPESPTKKLKV